MGLISREVANAIHVPYKCLYDIVNGRRGITPSIALRLAKYFKAQLLKESRAEIMAGEMRLKLILHL